MIGIYLLTPLFQVAISDLGTTNWFGWRWLRSHTSGRWSLTPLSRVSHMTSRTSWPPTAGQSSTRNTRQVYLVVIYFRFQGRLTSRQEKDWKSGLINIITSLEFEQQLPGCCLTACLGTAKQKASLWGEFLPCREALTKTGFVIEFVHMIGDAERVTDSTTQVPSYDPLTERQVLRA